MQQMVRIFISQLLCMHGILSYQNIAHVRVVWHRCVLTQLLYKVSLHSPVLNVQCDVYTSNLSLMEYVQALCGQSLLSFTGPPPVSVVLVGGELVQIRGP